MNNGVFSLKYIYAIHTPNDRYGNSNLNIRAYLT